MTTAIERLQAQSDRQKIEFWLTHIGEHDPACREEVLLACKNDITARAYYLLRYTQDCACATS